LRQPEPFELMTPFEGRITQSLDTDTSRAPRNVGSDAVIVSTDAVQQERLCATRETSITRCNSSTMRMSGVIGFRTRHLERREVQQPSLACSGVRMPLGAILA